MKKLIGIGIAAMMVMGLAGVANAAVDTDWQLYMTAGGKYTAGPPPAITGAGVDCKVGVAAAASVVTGSNPLSTGAYIRDMSLTTATANLTGVTSNVSGAGVVGTKVWDNLSLFTGGSFPVGATPMLKIYIWALGLDGTSPNLKMEVVTAKENTGLTAGQVIFSSYGATLGTKAAPAYSIDLTQYIAGINLSSPSSPAATFKLTATELIAPVPEPGSMVAMFSGLVGLVGFGIRRKK